MSTVFFDHNPSLFPIHTSVLVHQVMEAH